MTTFEVSRPEIPAVIELGGLRVRQAGALYVPVKGSDDRVHWAYQPRLRVGRISLWCQDYRFRNSPSGASAWATEELGFAPPCGFCAHLAPLPTRTPAPDREEVD
ncbi:hypothetical protein [Amycolatopsis lurida]|uniref:hypothetical protein n=1 Tax=Amycolatopsis lurida TaxID=31959 RepID=UPI00364C0168